MNYRQLISDNAGDFQDAELLMGFADNYADADGENITELDDNITEYADSITPIYYADIIKEWQDNNGDCRGLAKETFGEVDADGDAYKIMTQDLFCMYEQRLQADYQTLLDLIDDLPECDNCGQKQDTTPFSPLKENKDGQMVCVKCE